MICKHDWKVLHTHKEESPVIRLALATNTTKVCCEDPKALFGTYILIVVCKECGQIRNFTEKI